MNLKETLIFIDNSNLKKKSNIRETVAIRHYIIAYMYHVLKVYNLSELARIMDRHHGSIIHALKNAHLFQEERIFVRNTKKVRELAPMDSIPPYTSSTDTKRLDVAYHEHSKTMHVTIKLQKDEFIKYLKTKNQKVVLDALFNMIIEKFK